MCHCVATGDVIIVVYKGSGDSEGSDCCLNSFNGSGMGGITIIVWNSEVVFFFGSLVWVVSILYDVIMLLGLCGSYSQWVMRMGD